MPRKQTYRRFLTAGMCIDCGSRRPEGRLRRCGICRARQNARYIKTGLPLSETTRVGYLCELLVAADLNARCGRAYMNPEPQTKDDVFVRTSKGWFSVQVKKSQIYKTGNIAPRIMPGITSDIVAFVDFSGMRIRYIANVRALPEELADVADGPTKICSKFVPVAELLKHRMSMEDKNAAS